MFCPAITKSGKFCNRKNTKNTNHCAQHSKYSQPISHYNHDGINNQSIHNYSYEEIGTKIQIDSCCNIVSVIFCIIIPLLVYTLVDYHTSCTPSMSNECLENIFFTRFTIILFLILILSMSCAR